MKVLVVNAGSSSLKYQLVSTEDKSVLAKGNCERIGIDGSFLKHTPSGKESVKIPSVFNNHKDAIKKVLETLVSDDSGVIKDMDEIGAVGHRVVHGGESFAKSVIIDDEVMEAIRANVEIAPLHNPPNIMAIEACRSVMPNTPMVAVFDTAFHQTMPEEAYFYGLPYELYEKYSIRRYGFHGTSHKYVSLRAAELLDKPIDSLKMITCHLGNGSSITAINKGKSIDTSMGFTPLEGLPMGTRSGLIDPAIVNFIMEKENLSGDELDKLLNKDSGVLGISGVSSDFRDLEDAASKGNKRAKLALKVFNYQVKKYIGSYAAALGGVDCIVFTAGVGENTPKVRAGACEGLEFIGVQLDPVKNENTVQQKEGLISTDDSKVKVLVIPTNEELMIARETVALL